MSDYLEPPWHRQFWPWFILSLLLSVVIASFITLSIALQDPDGEVVGSIRASGSKVATHLELNPEGASVVAGIDDRLLIARLPQSLQANTLRLTLLHPTRAGNDIALPMSQTGSVEWVAELPPAAAGNQIRWQWLLQSEEPQWQAQGRLQYGLNSD
ncbi:MAG: FixH family protein [Gammaproteobacteria bacterium]